jgi:two-component system response regulator MprA
LQAAASRPSILLVDGRRGIREAVCNLLRAQGFECDSAGNGQAALRRLRAKGVDIVITEHSLPEVDALRLIRSLRGSGFEGRIFVHANQLDPVEEIECARNCVDRVVVRPGALADLLQELEETFARPRAEVVPGGRLVRAARQTAESPAATAVRASL